MGSKKDNAKAMGQEMQHIIEHAHALVDATSGEVDDRIKAARAALQERLVATRGEVDDVEDRLLEAVESADKFIHVKPYYAIGSTFIAGLFLGWLMSRK
jgi:ElaB/YqjD/DUF883 family membrane-anchored ribosome-binding protein